MEPEEKVDVEDIEIDHEEEKVQDAEKRITREEIVREMIVTSNGRDKVFVSDIQMQRPPNNLSWLKKLIQYSIRLGLFFHFSLTGSRLLRRPTRPLWEQDIVRRLQETASGLSFTR